MTSGVVAGGGAGGYPLPKF